ncbi:N-acyl homoserine lactonase family protein [Gemmatimonas groenlandica]|uniref:N-acyl homoserine lactonase family protein n=2 Tax=Gemmatimonas groenlandica TaxID=2732249 RepID=A0A6M4IWN3_9BACT|nr:N-acyl homoserine lactonase family protein [Gemmatimonas groenlandica]
MASIVAALASPTAHLAAQAAPTVTLTRMSCGTNALPTDVGLRFSDTFAFSGLMVQLTYSCYLVRHNDDYLIWDTGFAMGPGATAPKQSLVEMLGELKLPATSVKYVGISHYHGDHTGQAKLFPQATLLVGKGDWDALNDPKLAAATTPANFAPWISGGSKVEPLAADKDVFGDGSVMILNMPGHTPGHHSLLVKLREMGPVLITGDLSHFRENYESDGVPTFNTDRAASLASIDRFKRIAKNLKATVIIQHDQRDVTKLPAFPAAAK